MSLTIQGGSAPLAALLRELVAFQAERFDTEMPPGEQGVDPQAAVDFIAQLRDKARQALGDPCGPLSAAVQAEADVLRQRLSVKLADQHSAGLDAASHAIGEAVDRGAIGLDDLGPLALASLAHRLFDEDDGDWESEFPALSALAQPA